MKINISDIEHLMNHIDIIPREGVSEIMGEILAETPWIGWEIGPDKNNNDKPYLALTCGGDYKCLKELSDQLNIPIRKRDWAIIIGSPAKEWDRYFEIRDDQGNSLFIDAEKWKWKTNSKLLHISIYIEDINVNFDPEKAVKLFLIGEIGEWNYANCIYVDNIFSLKKSDDDCLSINKLRPYIEKNSPNYQV